MEQLLKEIRKCTLCLPHLSDGVNPILTASKKSKYLIIGQAPGSIVHRTGIPWDDKSGERLLSWLGVEENSFYDTDNFAILPMGFCYPGKGKSGDLPPRKECAPFWHHKVLEQITDHQLTFLIGAYAQKYYLGNRRMKTLTETVRNFESYLPEYLPLPHPSPRNNIWLKKNQWFENEVVPYIRQLVDCSKVI